MINNGMANYDYTCSACGHTWTEARVPKWAADRCDYKCDHIDCDARGRDTITFVESPPSSILDPDRAPEYYIPSSKVLRPNDFNEGVLKRIADHAGKKGRINHD